MIDDPRASGDEPSPANDDQTAPAAAAPAAAPGLEDLAQEVANLKDQLLRTLAELENTRRRARKEVEDASKYAIAGFARDILSVADNLARALSSVPAEVLGNDERLAALHQGVEMTGREIATVFERQGIKRVDPVGERFDPNLHQAMLEVPSGDHPAGTVVQVLQTGYTISGRLLRPALVAVAKAAPIGQAAPAESRGGQLNTEA
jgi:molecular chaperone GrpE